MIVSFTGHRSHKLGGYGDSELQQKVRKALHEELVKLSPAKAISGMALGVDQWAAEICGELEIPFIAAVPFKGQERMWPQASKEHYFALLEQANSVCYICDPGYEPWKMQQRNEWMIDNSDCVIAVWDGTNGGTGNCVKYAQSIGKTIHRINPNKL
jgi:uncharacterized phage-like protein YoqJ